jgi:hypothetical protein
MLYLVTDVVTTKDKDSTTLYHGIINAGNNKEALMKVASKQNIYVGVDDASSCLASVSNREQRLFGLDSYGRSHEVTISELDDIAEVYSFKS